MGKITMYTLDTNVIVYYLKKDAAVAGFVENAISENIFFYVSTTTEAELMSLPSLSYEELSAIDQILSLFSVFSVDSKIARIAAMIRRKYQSVKLPDAFIAATALFTGTTLVTRNGKDFNKIKELTVLII